MKRCMVLLITAAVFFNTFIYTADRVYAVTENNNTAEVMGLLDYLGIIKKEVDNPQALCTRELFALFTARCAGADTEAESTVRYYTDVEKDSYSANAVNFLAQSGVLTVGGDKRFRPSENIKPEEALKMLLGIMNYTSYAENRGGYPTGYFNTARELGITGSGFGGTVLTVEQAGTLIYNALSVKLYEAVSVSEGFGIKYDTREATLLSRYFGIYEAKGTVTGVYGQSIYSDMILCDENEVALGGEVYYIENDADYSMYLGCCSRIYFTEKNSGTRVAVYIMREKQRAKDIYIKTENFEAYAMNTVSYYETEDSRKKVSEQLEDAVVVYNGYPLEQNVDEYLKNLNKGEIIIRDRDNNGSYDTLMITDYENFPVAFTDKNTGTLYSAVTGTERISCNDRKCVSIFDESGTRQTFDEITDASVLMVAKSPQNACLTIINVKNEFSGMVTGVEYRGDGDFLLYIDGRAFELDKSYCGVFEDEYMLKNSGCVGMSFYFRTDAGGLIAYAGTKSSSDVMYGYLMDYSLNSGGVDESLKLKLLTARNETVIFSVSEKCRLDGIVYRKNFTDMLGNFYGAENKNGSIVVPPQVILYTVNENNEITGLDTAAYKEGYESSQNSFKSVFGEVTKNWMVGGRLGFKTLLNSETVVFYVPNDTKDAEDEDFFAGKYTDFMKREGSYFTDAYIRTTLCSYAGAVLCMYDISELEKNDKYKTAIMISGISKGISADGEAVSILSGYEDGNFTELEVSGEIDLSGLAEGDLVRFNYDVRGSIVPASKSGMADYELLYSASAENSGWDSHGKALYTKTDDAEVNYYRTPFQLSFGYVGMKDGSIVGWGYKNPGSIDEVCNITGAVVVYDSSEREGKRVYIGSVNDITDYKSSGDDCSKIILKTQYGVYGAAYIYK